MELPKTGKLYKKDFDKLGVCYTNQLTLDARIETVKILDAAPGYETSENIFRLSNAIKIGYEAPVYLKYVNDQVGYGVYADALLKENAIIGEYTGHVIDQDTVLRMSIPQTSFIMMIPACYAGYNWPESLYIDARRAGNCTRFINHSAHPNVYSKLFYDGVLWHVVLLASKNIGPHKQLFIDYGDGYWQIRDLVPENLDQE